jgi:hypothetical protein
MHPDLKKILKALSLELRHILEGRYDEQGTFLVGDLEQRLNQLGVWRDRASLPLDTLPHLSEEDRRARRVVDAYIQYRQEAGVPQREAVVEFVRESAYNWANRLLALRCMEARTLIDEVIVQKEVYGGRSMVHQRLARTRPDLLTGEDEGLFSVLLGEFSERAHELPGLFNPDAPAIVLRPSVAALKQCVALLSGRVRAGNQPPAGDDVFAAADALGWAYQYWNAEEKDRVMGGDAKIEGADIVPATQLYTEPYMVKFLVQNSLGALWMTTVPQSQLAQGWEYYVHQAERAPADRKPVQTITFLDPAGGSGHFLLEAFDLFYAMYEEEGTLSDPAAICASILNHNLYAIDIDERAIQIATAALWMKARERAWDLEANALTTFHEHLVATNIRLPQGKDHLQLFIDKYPEARLLRPALETVFEGLENAHELGSLLQIEEPVEKELRQLKAKRDVALAKHAQGDLFADMQQTQQGQIPLGLESYEDWKKQTLAWLEEHFEEEAEASDLTQAFFGKAVGRGLILFQIFSQKYDVVAANPPYLSFRNTGKTLSSFLRKHYPDAPTDTYSAMVRRSLDILKDQGYLAFVTQDGLILLPSLSELRERMLLHTQLEVVVHLGPRAFKDISGEKVSVTLTVASLRKPKAVPIWIRLVWWSPMSRPKINKNKNQCTLRGEMRC